MIDNTTLAEACEQWQGNRNGGSSPLRAAARVLLNVRHYFDAQFITDYDTAARGHSAQLARAQVLLDALNASPLRSADEWNAEYGLMPRAFAGRGLQGKPDQDGQILEALGTGGIRMPLWGVSLNPQIALDYGTSGDVPPRFILKIVGAFPAVPAWAQSGIKAEEEELICGGEYAVLDVEDANGTSTVQLSYTGPLSKMSE